MNLLDLFNRLRPVIQRYYTWKMDSYLEKVLNDRYLNKIRDASKSRRKPAIDLALDEYTRQQKEENVARSKQGINRAFKTDVID
jgi:hypothetical protein